MSSLSSIRAMLWEQLRLSRVEAGQRLGLGLVAGAAALVLLPEDGAKVAFGILMLVHCMFWFSISKLNGGRLVDGYKPGFPLHLLFTRPVTTRTFVVVSMVYDAVSCTALYLVSAALLTFLFGKPLPTFSVAVLLLSFHCLTTCVQWSTRNRAFQWIASISTSLPVLFLFQNRATVISQLEFTLIENAVMALAGVASIVFAIFGVARQRRGDSVANVPAQKEITGAYPTWLVSLFRFRCPTSSATRAQIWFELKSSGLPVLTIGIAVAIFIFLLFAVSIVFPPARHGVIGVTLFAIPVVLFGLGNNAFGIRRKQGRGFASMFEATQPYATAQHAGLKVLVRAACVLVALSLIGVSVWASGPLIAAWGSWIVEGGKNAVPDLLKVREKFATEIAGQAGYARAALLVFAALVVAQVIAWQATREALRVRYPRRLLVAQWLPTVWGLLSVLLAIAHRKGILSAEVVGGYFTATFWISGIALVLATIYLFWSGFAERLLTPRYAGGVLAVSAVVGLTWLAGPATNVVGALWLVLLVLTIGALAPWSLGRVRHM